MNRNPYSSRLLFAAGFLPPIVIGWFRHTPKWWIVGIEAVVFVGAMWVIKRMEKN